MSQKPVEVSFLGNMQSIRAAGAEEMILDHDYRLHFIKFIDVSNG